MPVAPASPDSRSPKVISSRSHNGSTGGSAVTAGPVGSRTGPSKVAGGGVIGRGSSSPACSRGTSSVLGARCPLVQPLAAGVIDDRGILPQLELALVINRGYRALSVSCIIRRD